MGTPDGKGKGSTTRGFWRAGLPSVALAAVAVGLTTLACSTGPTVVGAPDIAVLATQQDRPTALVVSSGYAYWINAGAGAIVRVATAGGTPATLASGQAAPSALAVDSVNVYWTNAGVGNCVNGVGAGAGLVCPGSAVTKVPLAGGAATTLATGTLPSAIATDGTDVYWVDNPRGPGGMVDGASIVKVAVSGGGTAVTLASGLVGVVALAVQGDTVFWTSQGSPLTGSVMKVGTHGGLASELGSSQPGVGPLAVSGTSLFWIDGAQASSSDEGSVLSAPVAGGAIRRLGVFPGDEGSALATDGLRVYWTRVSAYAGEGAVFSASAAGGGPVTNLASGDTSGGGLAIDSTSVYWTSTSDVMKLTPRGSTLGPTDAGTSGPYGIQCGGLELVCDGRCIDPLDDPKNCGGCGVRCPGSQECVSGQCACAYPTTTPCGDACVDSVTDPSNCGACGKACPGPQICSDSACVCANAGTLCGETCIVLMGSDPANCGACGRACPSVETCQMGACACPAGGLLCKGACVDAKADPDNCGTCGKRCPAAETCQAGVCACPNGGLLCGAACVDAQTDAHHCGGCGTVCGGATPYCAEGSCVATPEPGCKSGSAGVKSCGAKGASCCASPVVTGGTFFRTYDPQLADAGPITGPDGGAAGEADPATISSFKLDAYLVTVGRFREFVHAWNGGAGYLPAAGSGKHTHLAGGNGLVALSAPASVDAGSPGDGGGAGRDGATDGGAVAYEPGWDPGDDAQIAPTTRNLACGVEATWTPTPGAQESLPVGCVSWYEAYAFCIWDGGFLPSEAEWAYAAAGGSEQREYPWGSAPPGTDSAYAIYGDSAGDCYYPTGALTPCTSPANVAPVGTATLGIGRYGQLDLAGEMKEWVLDARAPYITPAVDGAFLGASPTRALRAGNFGSAEETLAPFRSAGRPGMRAAWVGFRCARAP